MIFTVQFFVFFYHKSNVFPAGLLATVPTNAINGASGSNVGVTPETSDALETSTDAVSFQHGTGTLFQVANIVVCNVVHVIL